MKSVGSRIVIWVILFAYQKNIIQLSLVNYLVSITKRLPTNVVGEFFVDSSCINCDTCREVAPSVFEESEGYSFVVKQPQTEFEILQTKQAVFSCPSGSIGSVNGFDRAEIRETFPLKISDNVYYNGFNSPNSFGAKSYFIDDKNGNWMIDSPKYSKLLVNKFEELGGLDYIFLTHRDDVAHADKFAYKFGAKRIIHYFDRSVQRDAEIIIKGIDPVEIEPGFTIIPTPGHTKGHCVLLYNNKFLFTGDHLYWRSDIKSLRATRNYCWWNWEEQVKSMERLKQYKFSWILPGHGHRKYFEENDMKIHFNKFYKKMSDPNYW
ncbi:MAG: Hydroxyacylglutathione hydrolase [Candidatus Heimdallarchaeota archaeon LC_2]|nr:MAG: Hydroxyacylglutathione hydrolase [Candidatus Heimdallarchaeota archaeon LC_2]